MEHLAIYNWLAYIYYSVMNLRISYKSNSSCKRSLNYVVFCMNMIFLHAQISVSVQAVIKLGHLHAVVRGGSSLGWKDEKWHFSNFCILIQLYLCDGAKPCFQLPSGCEMFSEATAVLQQCCGNNQASEHTLIFIINLSILFSIISVYKLLPFFSFWARVLILSCL